MIHRLKNIKENKHVKTYIKAMTPPYVTADIPHILGTLVVVILLFALSNVTLKHIFASNTSTTPPTKPQILVGTEHPLHIPFTHAEQGTVFIYWLPSSDPLGVAGYRVYRNGNKIADTTGLSFQDTGVSGNVTYRIESYDPAGNTAYSSLHILLPKTWTTSAAATDAVVSGFVVNKTTNSPIPNATITITEGKTIHTDQHGYFYAVVPQNRRGSVQLRLNALGYASDTETISLKSGQSVNTTIFLTPQPKEGNGIIDMLLKFFHK